MLYEFHGLVCDPEALILPCEAVEEIVPNLKSLVVGEIRIVNYNVDTRNKGVVEGSYAVGC